MRKVLIGGIVGALAMTGVAVPAAGASHIDEYVAYSSANQEVPRTGEDGWAWSVFRVYEDRIEYSSTMFDVDDIQGAHIHDASRGENGPIIVDLTDDLVDDTRLAGTITSDEVQNGDIGTLVAQMADESVYLNFHTAEYPDGAIRGQIEPSFQFDRTPVESVVYDLQPVDHDPEADGGSNPTGTATISARGNMLTVNLQVSGMAPNLPHAEHIHGMLMSGNECPSLGDDADGDGLINTMEGVPAYGPIQVSLTTTGDTSPDSGLAVDRFPVADEGGSYTYSRTIEVSDDVAMSLRDLHVVVHGIDVNGNGEYDFEAGESSLDPSLPLEATVPALCGTAADQGQVGDGDGMAMERPGYAQP